MTFEVYVNLTRSIGVSDVVKLKRTYKRTFRIAHNSNIIHVLSDCGETNVDPTVPDSDDVVLAAVDTTWPVFDVRRNLTLLIDGDDLKPKELAAISNTICIAFDAVPNVVKNERRSPCYPDTDLDVNIYYGFDYKAAKTAHTAACYAYSPRCLFRCPNCDDMQLSINFSVTPLLSTLYTPTLYGYDDNLLRLYALGCPPHCNLCVDSALLIQTDI